VEIPHAHRRRWSVIASGLLVAALALVVTFTNRAAFFSPVAVVVVAAVGVMALLLQMRFRYPGEARKMPALGTLNIAGVILALAAFLGDLLHMRVALAETMALAAVGCFGISGALALRDLRKRRAER
jgi:uncharacterized membrane protein